MAKDIQQVERVQRRAVRLVKKDYRHTRLFETQCRMFCTTGISLSSVLTEASDAHSMLHAKLVTAFVL